MTTKNKRSDVRDTVSSIRSALQGSRELVARLEDGAGVDASVVKSVHHQMACIIETCLARIEADAERIYSLELVVSAYEDSPNLP